MASRWNTILDAMKVNIEAGTYPVPVTVENRAHKTWSVTQIEGVQVQVAGIGFEAQRDSRAGFVPQRQFVLVCFRFLDRDDNGDVDDDQLDEAESIAEAVLQNAVSAIPDGAAITVEQPERMDERKIAKEGIYLTVFSIEVLDDQEVTG